MRSARPSRAHRPVVRAGYGGGCRLGGRVPHDRDRDGAGLGGRGVDQAPGALPLAAAGVVRVRVAEDHGVRVDGARDAGDELCRVVAGVEVEVSPAVDAVHVTGCGFDDGGPQLVFEGDEFPIECAC